MIDVEATAVHYAIEVQYFTVGQRFAFSVCFPLVFFFRGLFLSDRHFKLMLLALVEDRQKGNRDLLLFKTSLPTMCRALFFQNEKTL